jgi:hypothetical protein
MGFNAGGGGFSQGSGIPVAGQGGDANAMRQALPIPTGGYGDPNAMRQQLAALLAPSGGTGENWNYARQGYGGGRPYNYAGYGVPHPIGAPLNFGQVNSSTMPGVISQPTVGQGAGVIAPPTIGRGAGMIAQPTIGR